MTRTPPPHTAPLRSAPPHTAAGPLNTPPHTVVVGGGIAGLATAALLAREGHSVDLLERGAEVGGRAGLHVDGGFRFDTGPSWYLMPEVFDHFFRLFGTSSAEQLDLVPLDPGYRVFPEPVPAPGGADLPTQPDLPNQPGLPNHEAPRALPIDVPRGRARVLELFERLEPGCAPRVNAYLDTASEAYDLALRHFLYTTFADLTKLAHPEVERRAGTLMRLLGTSLADRIEATVQHPVLRQVLGYPAVFLANRPDRTPGIYQLMSRLDLIDGVDYPLGGMRTVIDAIARVAVDAGVRIHTNAEVTALHIARARGAGRGRRRGRANRVYEVVARTPDGLEVFTPDLVVTTADLHHVETQLLPSRFRSIPARAWRRRNPGMGGLVMMLGVEGRVPELEHHNLFFTRDWDANFDAVFGGRSGTASQTSRPGRQGRAGRPGEGPAIPAPASVYVCAPSRTDPSVAPAGHENLFVLVPIRTDVSARAGDPAFEAACDRIVDQVGAWAGVPDLRDRVVSRRTMGPGDFVTEFHAWRGTVLGPAHTLVQSVWFRGRPQNPKVGNLLHAGAFSAPGVGLPMCLIGAENVLKAVRGDVSGGWVDDTGGRLDVARERAGTTGEGTPS